MPMRITSALRSQYAEEWPATNPARMLSEAPPCSLAVTTSRTWRDSVDVNTLTNSGMIAPASVPHVMIVARRHHIVESPPSVGMRRYRSEEHTSDLQSG